MRIFAAINSSIVLALFFLSMKVSKHYESDHVILYVEEGDLNVCITLDCESQVRRLGECLIDLVRTGSREVSIIPN